MDRKQAEAARQSDIQDLLTAETPEDDVQAKLDLARGYAEIGDNDAAANLLQEIITQGDDDEREEAKRLVAYIKHRLES